MPSTINASTTGLGGIITTGDNSGSLALQTAGTTALTISSGQVITASGSIGIGGTTPSSGTGITFPASQSASSNANTLDDYEEGTWTPTVTGYGGSVTAYTSQGSYVKIGKIVFCTVFSNVTNAGTASGAYMISNLPFSIATTAEVYGYGVNLVTNSGLVAFGYNSTTLLCTTYSGAFPGGSGTYVTLNFNYSI